MRHYRLFRAIPHERGGRFQVRELFGGTTEDLRALLDEGWLPEIAGGTVDTFTADGTWTAPTGVTSADVECWGGGGGGGGADVVSDFTKDAGGGGGGGAYSKSTVTVTPATGYAIAVGAAGAAGAVRTNGGTGGDSTFASTTVVAKGGTGGRSYNGGTSTSSGGPGGASASGTGTTKFSGGTGGAGFADFGTGEGGGGGGSSAGTAANGNTGGAGTSTTGGAGGTAPTGGFAGGAGGSRLDGNLAADANGGGGGGGGGVTAGNVEKVGAAGRPGKVTVTYTPTATDVAGSESFTESESSSISVDYAGTDSGAESESSGEAVYLGGPFLLDNFTDTDGLALESHLPDLGGKSWTVQAGGAGAGAKITSNRVRSDGSNRFSLATVTPASADYDVEAVVRVISNVSFSGAGVLGRASSGAQTMYVGFLFDNGGIVSYGIQKRVAGVATNLVTGALSDQSLGVDHTVRLVMRGTTLTLLVDGAQIAQVTDAAISAVGQAGIYASGTATTGYHVDSVQAWDSPVPVSDSATLSESASVVDLGVQIDAADSAAASAAAALDVDLAPTDAQTLAEAAALAADSSGSDSGAFSESAELAIEPDTIITGGPAEGSLDTDRTPTFTFTSPDAWDNFEWRVDGGSWTALGAGIATVTLPTQSLGGHVFEVRAVRSGFPDASPATRAWVVDLVRPSFTVRRPEVPLWLEVEVEDVSGRKVRWGHEERPENRPSGITHSSAIPGGYTNGGCQLPRDLRRTYGDLGLLRAFRLYGAGGETRYEGRISDVPGSGGGAESSLNVVSEGYWRHLADDASFMEIIVDRDLGAWRGISEPRQAALLLNDSDPRDGSLQWVGDPNDPTFGQMAIVMTHDGAARNVSPISESWYDGRHLRPAKVYFDYAPLPNAGATPYYIETDPNFNAHVGNAADEAISGAWEGSGEIANNHSYAAYLTFATKRRFLFLQYSWEQTTWGHTLGYAFAVRFAKVAVYGDHGLPLSGSDPQGVLGSDVIALALSRNAPMLNYSTGAGGSIEPSSFVIPHMKYMEPTTPETVILAVTALGGAGGRANDWGVYSSPAGPEFFWKTPGSYGKKWRVRIGGTTTLSSEGPAIGDAINGVVVSWQSADGETHYIGPTGSGLEATSSLLLDTDPENPANQIRDGAGNIVPRWPPLSIGITTFAIAEQAGALFLSEARQRKMRGSVSHVGPIEDDRGILYPPSAVQAGDELEILNLPERGPFRLIGAAHAQDGYSVSMTLDAPPARLDVMLERFQSALAAAGL